MKKRNFLLDTNTLSSFAQKNAKHHAIIVSKTSALDDNDEVYMSIVSLYEMEYGAKHAQDSNTAQEMRIAIEVIKNSFQIVHLTTEGAKIGAVLKNAINKQPVLEKKLSSNTMSI